MSLNRTSTMWPEGESACIWMEAGIIDFKLCDRNRDCEQCPFDAIMKNDRFFARVPNQGEKNAGQTVAIDSIERLRKLIWDDSSYYGNRYWFVKPLGQEKALLGLNELAQQILPTVKDIILVEGGEIVPNQPIAWLVTNSGTLYLNAPFKAYIQKTNPALLLDLNQRDRKVWLFTITSKNLSNELSNLLRGNAAAHFLDTRREKIINIFESEMYGGLTSIGETMQDGGEKINNIEQMIGPRRYFNIICDFFQSCTTIETK